ncbi:hypothetical protein CAPTEDRAFT_186471 [Capitella teleta]|uniref:Neurotransmitter-gated ion-channel ligand-binding domain-containing protein n=1 Tax=Capitella teleta TaxID=283909 RepID=R7TEP1_CAPTE|nr:hypothetical protein CAPTEDRAFT_186471 [Capitella teleta]|eukprot:ELT89942.1 hypothetical protein CAPTEDRAFT_186471 [Capitella teleta]
MFTQDEDEVNWNLYWSSKLNVDNLLADTSDVTWKQIRWSDEGEATVYEKRRIKGTFLENMELNEFPFDYQDLSVTVISGLSENEIALENDDIEISNINIQFFICSLSFSTFTVQIDIPQNRLQLSFTLVLTTIAFKFVANQSLPKISYLTYLDKYILTSMAILCCICVWHAIVPVINENFDFEKAENADRIALALLGTAYVLFHVIFLLTIYLEVCDYFHYVQHKFLR